MKKGSGRENSKLSIISVLKDSFMKGKNFKYTIKLVYLSHLPPCGSQHPALLVAYKSSWTLNNSVKSGYKFKKKKKRTMVEILTYVNKKN